MNILNDTEHRIFLSAMAREKKVCQKIDGDKIYDSTVKMLVPICESIEHKVDRAISLEKVKQTREELERIDTRIAIRDTSLGLESYYVIDKAEALKVLDKLISESERVNEQ